jgi:hypothetical protein
VFQGVRAIAAADDGAVHVLDDSADVVQSFTPTGTFLRSWLISPNREPGTRLEATDLAAGPDGSVFVTSARLPRMWRFDRAGTVIGVWDHWATLGPDSIAVGPAFDVYTTAWNTFAVERFSPAGDRLGAWGAKGHGPGEFGGDCELGYGSCRAGPVAVDAHGLVYVGDGGLGRIQRFTREGRFVDAIKYDDALHGGSFSGRRFDIDRSQPSPRLLALDGNARGIHVIGSEPPDLWRAEYFGNRWLAERPLLVEYRPELDLEWSIDAPVLKMPTPALSARFQRYTTVPGGVYRFSFSAQGGARLWVDEALVVDRWDETVTQATVEVPLGPLRHDLLVEYRSADPAGAVALSWLRVADLETAHFPVALRP